MLGPHRSSSSWAWRNPLCRNGTRRNSEGTPGVTRDLTEAKRAEAGRLKLLQAEAAVRLRDEFLSIASHELKTPLNSLQLLTSSILRGAADARSIPKS